MLFRRIVKVIVLLVFYVEGYSNSSGLDSLIQVFNNSKADTLRVKIALQIAQNLASSSPDSSIAWIKKGLLFANKANSSIGSDSTLFYYKGVAHASLGMTLSRTSIDLVRAKAHADTSIEVFSQVLRNKNRWIRFKALHGLSVSYGLLGRLSYMQGEIQLAIYHYTKSLEVQIQLNRGHGVAMLQNNLGLLHAHQANYIQAVKYYQSALSFFEAQNDSLNTANVRVNMGNVSKDLGAYDIALRNYFEALDIFSERNTYSSLAATELNIGEVYLALLVFNNAMIHFKKAYILFRDINDNKGIADSYTNLGITYSKQNRTDSAQFFLRKAQQIYTSQGLKIGLANVSENLGETYYSIGKTDEAIKLLNESLALNNEMGRKSNSLSIKLNLSRIFLDNKQLDKAKLNAKQVLYEADKQGYLKTKRDACKVLSEIYELEGLSDLALRYHKQYSEATDSLFSIERVHKIAQLEALYNLSQKQSTISALEKEKSLKEVELSKAHELISYQRFHSILSLVVLGFLLIVLFILYRQFRIKREAVNQLSQKIVEVQNKNEEILTQKEEIEAQRNELESQKFLLKEKSEQLERFNWLLTDSIDYASSIQSALLPSTDVFQKYFSDHFIVFFPKDVVSGDSYWAYPFDDDTILIALLDCTGHGVPGGFMSMMGISALTELMGRKITEPSETLNNLRLFVIDSFKQTGKMGEQRDGMDIALIRYKKGSGYVEYAGANHPLWLIKKNETDDKQIWVHKADSMPISYFPRMEPFKTQRIEVEPGDQIYLFSDGFRDQLGGENFNLKYGRERFKELIIQVSTMPMDAQKSFIEDAFFRWIDGNDQLDDITILGLKV